MQLSHMAMDWLATPFNLISQADVHGSFWLGLLTGLLLPAAAVFWFGALVSDYDCVAPKELTIEHHEGFDLILPCSEDEGREWWEWLNIENLR